MRPSDGLRDEPADDLSSWRVREVIRAAWGHFGRHWGVLTAGLLVSTLAVGGVAYGTAFGLTRLMTRLRPGAAVGLLPLLAAVTLALLLNAFFRVGLVRMWCDAARGNRPRFGQLFRGGDRFLPLTGALILRALLVTVAFVPLVLPGVVLALGFSLTEFYVVDRGLSPLAALRASWDASVGKKGRVMLYLLGALFLLPLGYLVVVLGALVAVSVISLGLTVIYLSTPVLLGSSNAALTVRTPG